MIVFYNIVSIAIGLLLIYYGIYTLIKKKKVAFSVLTLVHSIFFIGFGIFGFVIDKDSPHQIIVVLGMLAFTITEIICFFTLNKKLYDDKK